jgi:hypothetical protein
MLGSPKLTYGLDARETAALAGASKAAWHRQTAYVSARSGNAPKYRAWVAPGKSKLPDSMVGPADCQGQPDNRPPLPCREESITSRAKLDCLGSRYREPFLMRLTIACAVSIAAPGVTSFWPAAASAPRRSGDQRSSVASDASCDGELASSAAPHASA